MENLKQEIKKLAQEQISLKQQRKTVYLIGERTLPSWEASYRHFKNRHKLRIMYAAYGQMKGKTYSQIENHYSEDSHPLNEFKTEIESIIKKYESTTIYSN